jgi:hypothetical protein
MRHEQLRHFRVRLGLEMARDGVGVHGADNDGGRNRGRLVEL